MKIMLVLTLFSFAASAHAQYPYQGVRPTCPGSSYQAWATANDLRNLQRVPYHNDGLCHLEMLTRIRMQKEMANYFEEQSHALRAIRQSEELGSCYANPYKKRLYKNPYR